MTEVLTYRPETLTVEGLRGFFADVFATLDAHPRELDVRVEAPSGPDLAVDFTADFRRRWLAEHPVPLVLKANRTTRLKLLPTSANRVKVRAFNRAVGQINAADSAERLFTISDPYSLS